MITLDDVIRIQQSPAGHEAFSRLAEAIRTADRANEAASTKRFEHWAENVWSERRDPDHAEQPTRATPAWVSDYVVMKYEYDILYALTDLIKVFQAATHS